MIAAMATTRRADMFTADGKPSDDDPREHGPRLGDERVTLVESLRRQRLTLEMKCSGLDAEAMARLPTPRWLRRPGTRGVPRWTSPRGSWPRRPVSTSPATIPRISTAAAE